MQCFSFVDLASIAAPAKLLSAQGKGTYHRPNGLGGRVAMDKEGQWPPKVNVIRTLDLIKRHYVADCSAAVVCRREM